MSHALTPTAAFTGSVVVPDDGDLENAASVNTAFQTLTDRAAYLRQQAFGASNYASYSIPLSSGQDDSGAAATVCWTYQFGAWIETNKAAGNKLVIDVVFPDRCTITSVAVYCTGNVLGGSAHSALPATKPKVTFREITPHAASAPTISFSASVTDAPANVTAYEAYHILGGGLTVGHVIDAANCAYRLEIEGEQSTNALNSYFAVSNIFYAFTAP